VTTGIESALGQPGPLVAAWETWTERDDRGLGIFSVEPGPLRELASTRVPESERAALTDSLRLRGVRIGAHDPRNEHVWCADERGFALWSQQGIRAAGSEAELRLAGGPIVRKERIRAVVSFVDEPLVHRGVRLDLIDGAKIVVAEEEDAAPLADPTYNRDNLAIDASWARYLGAALAAWLRVPHLSQLP
jgi:hypothetical protein